MRRPTIAPALVGLVLAGCLVVGTAPAGAAVGPHLGVSVARGATSLRAGLASHAGPVPLSSGWIETQGKGAGQSYDTGPVSLSPSSSTSLIHATVATQAGPFLVAIGNSGPQGFEPGNLYTTSASVTLLVQHGPTSCLNGAEGAGGIKVDQLTRDRTGAITSLAFQFDCFQGATNFFGAVAFAAVPTTPGAGYYLYEHNGAITGFGNDNFLSYLGDLSATSLTQPIVGMAITPDGGGYWMVATDGGIFAYGDAGFYGSTGNIHLNEPVVGMTSTPDGGGYWLVASDGGIFSYGDAVFRGSMGARPLNQPIVGMATSPAGYWLVAADGGIFAFDAAFYGSTGAIRLNKPVVGMTAAPGGTGYWFVASDGGIFAYGSAAFHGSTGAMTLASPVVGMSATSTGSGYWLAAADGGIFAFAAPFEGSLGGLGLTDVAGIAS